MNIKFTYILIGLIIGLLSNYIMFKPPEITIVEPSRENIENIIFTNDKTCFKYYLKKINCI
jgi:uncharacterized membrane protein YgaE (UPF0421/DUF939 family)